ncbi:hypothetical protein DFH07DRAFT_748821 [Mycena maculata]|uniref:PHD-type domain-containing protein n=1 Tax=Mycena maculata TaxID=230809 RepID=A0AAD7N4R1_9AGAR|nr:hypothetical protein DFH07DRAFT_748821 [Mycena maculata]
MGGGRPRARDAGADAGFLGAGGIEVIGGRREEEEGGDEIRCRCGSSADDGFSIACDVCGRWCHAACFGISKESVPEEWACWMCVARHPHVGANGSSKSRRRGSVRASTVEPSPPMGKGDELAEDEKAQYVALEEDVVPHASTQRKLRAYAAQWRGVSAISTSPPPAPAHTSSSTTYHTPFVFPAPPPAHPTSLHPLPLPSPILPPSFALHAAAPAPPATFLAKYPSVITPSSAYLRDPLSGYAHMGVPKRFVHIVGPPLEVALDARGRGGRGRWVRSGCWPNAEVRAYVCPGAGERDARGRGSGRQAREREDEARTHFGIFATRALREGEEIVVGWEWDDGNAVHRVGEVAGHGEHGYVLSFSSSYSLSFWPPCAFPPDSPSPFLPSSRSVHSSAHLPIFSRVVYIPPSLPAIPPFHFHSLPS